MGIRVHDKAVFWFNDVAETQYYRGLNKYGTPLETFNGRDAYTDAMQEAVDLVAYLTQLNQELIAVKKALSDLCDAVGPGLAGAYVPAEILKVIE
jgi:hypothetical protein